MLIFSHDNIYSFLSARFKCLPSLKLRHRLPGRGADKTKTFLSGEELRRRCQCMHAEGFSLLALGLNNSGSLDAGFLVATTLGIDVKI